MKKRNYLLAMSIYLWSAGCCLGQTISATVPHSIDPDASYLFYLHGGIVQDQGPDAVSEYFGAYKYQNILDTLSSYGFQVISEVRPKGTVELEYAEKLSSQINRLMSLGVPPENITIAGASLGGYITIELANILQNENINYVLLGLCSDYALDFFSKYKDKLCGNFLSFYEATDQKGPCQPLLGTTTCKKGFREIPLNMGVGHGFLYKPYPEWVIPMVQWINKQ